MKYGSGDVYWICVCCSVRFISSKPIISSTKSLLEIWSICCLCAYGPCRTSCCARILNNIPTKRPQASLLSPAAVWSSYELASYSRVEDAMLLGRDDLTKNLKNEQRFSRTSVQLSALPSWLLCTIQGFLQHSELSRPEEMSNCQGKSEPQRCIDFILHFIFSLPFNQIGSRSRNNTTPLRATWSNWPVLTT